MCRPFLPNRKVGENSCVISAAGARVAERTGKSADPSARVYVDAAHLAPESLGHQARAERRDRSDSDHRGERPAQRAAALPPGSGRGEVVCVCVCVCVCVFTQCLSVGIDVRANRLLLLPEANLEVVCLVCRCLVRVGRVCARMLCPLFLLSISLPVTRIYALCSQPTFVVEKHVHHHTTTRYPFWRWVNYFNRTFSWALNAMFWLGVSFVVSSIVPLVTTKFDQTKQRWQKHEKAMTTERSLQRLSPRKQ